ncbi:hypothetical protein [Ferrimonas gelatinilytica]|uniref:Leucine-rich repeat domain-containing protein n=1 Tax=Ferrimonas gelatinilytica TaxID=1255257 RepID=A0ABP9S146_9GAMM
MQGRKLGGLLGAALLVLTGCEGGDSDELAGIEFASPALQQCFDDIRTDYGLTELSDYIMLHCQGYPVTSLGGIEALPYLESVAFDSEHLETLAFNDNPGIWQVLLTTPNLTQLDLSGLPDLANLIVSGSTPLTSLDLSDNPLLSRVWVAKTGLTTLDLFQHAELTELVVEKNPALTTLTLGQSPELAGLWGSENALTHLALSGLPKLEILSVSFNQLTELDVAANTELEALLASFNQLQTINLDSNAQLQMLTLLENPLSDETRAYLDSLGWKADQDY